MLAMLGRLTAGTPTTVCDCSRRVLFGLVSDRGTDGRLLIVHNIGAGAKVEDVLFAFTITGHYRYLPHKG